MPTYVYECKKCGETLEVDQRITEDPLTDCPCGAKSSLKRVIQRTAVMFKGSGFHINDYASSASSSASDKSDRSDSSSKSDKSEKSDKKEPPAAPAKADSGGSE